MSRRVSWSRRPNSVQHGLLPLADLLRAEAHEAAILRGVSGGLRRGDQPPPERRCLLGRGLAATIACTARSSSSTCLARFRSLAGLYPLSGLCRCCAMAWTSSATSASSCSRLGGLVALFIVAIDSLVASIGPPGSASEIARPATIGARTTRATLLSEVALGRHSTSFLRGHMSPSPPSDHDAPHCAE